MLELFDQNPLSRVFRVDSECYVVYLGSHWDDYRPFLRLGTSTSLPPTLPPIVSTIVVPDVLTGNPLDEIACLAGDATPETRYVGDVKTVEHFKAFIGQDTIPVADIEAVDHEEDDGKHVLIYYYKDGNLKIKFKKNEILDLRRRESVDQHFVSRAQVAKNNYGKSPFKLPGDAYQQPGFVVVRGSTYLVSRGEIAAFTLSPDYFFDLSAAGVDADRVSTIRTEDVDVSLVECFKRSRTRDRALRIVSPRIDRVRAATGLFPKNSLPELKANPVDGHGGSFPFHRFHLTQASGRFDATVEGIDAPLVFGSAPRKLSPGAIVVDAAAGTLSAGGRDTYPLIEGAVYHLAAGAPARADVEARFLLERNYPYRDLISDAENTLLSQLEYYCNELFAGRDPSKVLRTIKALDPVRAIGKAQGIHPVVQVFLHNYTHYLALVARAEPQLSRTIEPLASVLEKHAISRSDVPDYLPLVGEIMVDSERTYLFYRLVARVTSDRYAHAASLATTITARPVVDYESERTRLADLIAGLATPEQMDEARMRRIAEAKKKKPTAAAAAAAAAGEEGSAGSESSGERGSSTSTGATADGNRSKPRASGPTGRRSRRGGWVVPAVVGLLVLLALFFLLYTDTIPNPWFGTDSDLLADGTDPAGGDANGPGATGPDGSAGPDTPTDGGDGLDPDATGADATGGAAGADSTGVDSTGVDSTGVDSSGGPATEGAVLPEGWPAEALPALRALEQIPGIVITDTSVIDPSGIEITIFDIIRLVNRIAVDNEYAPMGVEADPGRDPDWIYPEQVFELPNGTRYAVVAGDTLWAITVRYMVARLRQDFERYTALVDEYELETTTIDRRSRIIGQLREIGEESHTENFARKVVETIRSWE